MVYGFHIHLIYNIYCGPYHQWEWLIEISDKTITKKKNDEAPMFCCCMNFDYASFTNEFKQVGMSLTSL